MNARSFVSYARLTGLEVGPQDAVRLFSEWKARFPEIAEYEKFMSRVSLFVRRPNGDMLYGIYDATVDVAYAQLFKSVRDAWATYRSDPTFHTARCPGHSGEREHVRETVQCFADYGSEICWHAIACPICSLLVDRRDPYKADQSEYRGKPFPWVEELRLSWEMAR